LGGIRSEIKMGFVKCGGGMYNLKAGIYRYAGTQVHREKKSAGGG